MRLLLATLAFAAALAAPATAATPTVKEFPGTPNPIPNGSSPDGIAASPDGNLWFAEVNGDRIGRMTPSGQLTEFNATGIGKPHGIAAGPDDNMYFTESNGTADKAIASITPSGLIDELPFNNALGSNLSGITAGPDGNLWFADDAHRIGRVDPALTSQTESSAGITGLPVRLATGADGKIWFTEPANPDEASVLGRVDPATFPSAATEFAIAGVPNDIAAGPDGKIWFTRGGSIDPAPPAAPAIGRIDPNAADPASTITYFTTGLSGIPGDVVAGPDGNLWFTENGDVIGRITPSGVITEFPAGSGSSPAGIVAGPDGNLWYTAFVGQRIGRINTALDQPRFSDRARIDIPAAGAANPYPSTIEVNGLQGTVTDVNVRLNGLHDSSIPDVQALLVGPHGQSTVLTDTSLADDVTTGQVITLDDEGVTSPAHLVSGIFKPIASLDPIFDSPAPDNPHGDSLSVFDGTDPTGQWQLYVEQDNHVPGSSGSLTGGWSLDIQTTGPPPQEIPGPPTEVQVPGPTTTITTPGPVITDTTRPALRLSGPPSRVTQTALRAGPKVTVTPSEPVTLDITLSAKPKTVTVADTDALLLFDRTIRATRATSITAKPATRFLGRPKKAFRATLRIVATDNAGNRTTVSRTITVSPDKQKIRRARR